MESWLEGKLVGGCYGIKIGHMFYGESMFHTETDASKVAFVHLVNKLKNEGVGMIDCQIKTPLLASFGGHEIEREAFIQKLNFFVGADLSAIAAYYHNHFADKSAPTILGL
jgi:leucyl/phenylalanyl-tRNA--protein transferase